MAHGKRSGEAQAAQHRKAGPMKHRLAPRGGSQKDEWAEQCECDHDLVMSFGSEYWCSWCVARFAK